MTDPYDEHELSPDPAHEDAWLRDRYPAASADFVDQTLARVMADRQQVTEDAAKVEEIQFEPTFLAHLQVPEVSSGFVDRMLAEVMAQHQQRESKERALQRLMAEYTVPPTSPDFIRRTLSALGVRPKRRPAAVSRWPVRAWVAAAALLLALPFVIAPWLSGPAAVAGPPMAVYTPVRFAGVMAAAAEQREGFALRGPQLGDGLVTLAYMGRR